MAETDFKYDVFISYSHKDEEWVVNTLLPSLEDAGLRVCIDFRDFVPGKPSRANMRDACKESAYTVLVMTPAWVASEWTSFESLLSFLHDPAGKRQRTVPMMIEQCDIPEDIQIFTYVDFLRKDRADIGWKQLFTALGKLETNIPVADQKESGENTPASWFLAHPYPMPPNFTGRIAEREMLTKWLNEDTENRLFIIRALGGFGKSALTWHWITHDVDPSQWTKLVWWSFYEGDASFEHFIEETLKYLKLEVPQGQRPQVGELLKAMQAQKILLIMDGFERVLRLYGNMNAAYQSEEEQNIEDDQLVCKDINAEWFLRGICSLPDVKSKVLMTTRLTPRALRPRGEFLEGCLQEELTVMQKKDAVEFFQKQKIKGTHTEIEAACAWYGYHPLSLRILTGLIINDREKPGYIEVAENLDITNDIIQNKNHVLKVAYDSLSLDQQKLLSNIACFRAPTNYQLIKVISGTPSRKRKRVKFIPAERLVDSLEILENRGLLVWDRATNRYDLHPIVRRYAYERLPRASRIAAHTRVHNFLAKVDTSELEQIVNEIAHDVELYYHTAQAEKFDMALAIFAERLWTKVYYQFGAYQLCIELLSALFRDGTNKLPHLQRGGDQAWALNSLANAYSMSGQPRRALAIFQNSVQLEASAGYKPNVAIGLGNIADTQPNIGILAKAEENFKRAIKLCQEIGNTFEEATDYCRLGRLLALCGEWKTSDSNLLLAQTTFDNMGVAKTNYGSVNMSYRALRLLLMIRAGHGSLTSNLKSSIEFTIRALKLAEETKKMNIEVQRDFIRAYWLLGAAYLLDGQLNIAERHLSSALTLCRAINSVVDESDILLDLARLRYDQENYEEAKSLAEEALHITERCGYVLQGADVNLFLAQYALEQEKDKVKAKEYAETALKLATCDGPPYYYKVAYEEAERMLEKL
jgi:tetratricopeptide (TPR) repeat protein